MACIIRIPLTGMWDRLMFKASHEGALTEHLLVSSHCSGAPLNFRVPLTPKISLNGLDGSGGTSRLLDTPPGLIQTEFGTIRVHQIFESIN